MAAGEGVAEVVEVAAGLAATEVAALVEAERVAEDVAAMAAAAT